MKTTQSPPSDPWLAIQPDLVALLASGGQFMFPPLPDSFPESGVCDSSMMPRPMNLLDLLRSPKTALAAFRVPFDEPKARERRAAAVMGNQGIADAPLSNLIDMARRFNGPADDGWEIDALKIAGQIAELVTAGNHAAFQRMAAIVQNGGIRYGEKGGSYSAEGMVFASFCKLIRATRALPTKKALREDCGFVVGKQEEETFRKACKSLGLNGLPTAK